MTLSPINIRLNDIRLYGHHGITPEEQAVGNHFIINLTMTIDAGIDDFDEDTLERTINYATAYSLINEEFTKPSATLENLAVRILKKLFTTFPLLKESHIEIKKINPPLSADCASASVEIGMQR